MILIFLILAAFTIFAGCSSFKIGGNKLTGAAVLNPNAKPSELASQLPAVISPVLNQAKTQNNNQFSGLNVIDSAPILPALISPERPRHHNGGGSSNSGGSGGAPLLIDFGNY